MIHFNAVTKQFGKQTALKDIDLTVSKGEFLALLGHNGAGKTTLMKLILGLTKPSTGQVSILKHNPCGNQGRDFRKSVGFLPESVVFSGEMTGLDTLRFYARLKGLNTNDCMSLLDRVYLEPSAARRRVKTYSKGMRQRLGLAQALLGQPKLLLLDEPTTGLDPSLRRTFYDILAQLKKKGTTILLSSHILPELESQCDRVAILESGHLVALGSIEQLRQQTGLPVTFKLNSNNSLESLKQQLDIHYPNSEIKGQKLHLTCPMEEKVNLLATLTKGDFSLSDIEITLPNLDDIYFHFRTNKQSVL